MRSLRLKIILTVLCVTILSNIVVGFIVVRGSIAGLQENVNVDIAHVAHSIATAVADENEKEFKVLYALASNPQMQDPAVPLSEKAKIAKAVVAIDKDYVNIAVIDMNGKSYTESGDLIDFSEREYFKTAAAGNKYVSDPYINKVNQKMSIFFSIPLYDASKRIIGVLVTIKDGYHLSSISENLVIGKNSHPVIISRVTGNTIGDADRDNVTNAVNFKQIANADKSLKALAAMLEKADNGETGVTQYPYKGDVKLAAYEPVPDTDWFVIARAPMHDFTGSLKAMLVMIITAFVIMCVISIAICAVVISLAVKPLLTVKTAINGIATGSADLTQRIKVLTKDEIGAVVEGFNKFTGKLQSIISDVKGSKDVLATAGSELHDITEDTAASITQILANIDSVNGQITNQAASVEETAGAVNEIASNIASLERMIENQSSGVTQASAAVEEMIGNIGSVNQSVEKMANSFQDLEADAQTGAAKQEDVNGRIDQIESQSEMLQDANTAIAAIASQTNLLAMNAAIEAAHAGEAGKGFSVVADEIRKLSETSSAQSKTIGDQLNKIKESIGAVVSASAESSTAFQSVSAKIHETDELVRQIKSAMEEQQEGSKQIGEALHSMNDSTSEVRTASSEMSAGNKAILEEVKHLQDATAAMKDSVAEMATGAKKIHETGSALSDVAGKMNTSIIKIGSEIDQFKV